MVAEFNKQQQRSFGPATLVDSLPAEQRVQSSTHAARRKAERGGVGRLAVAGHVITTL